MRPNSRSVTREVAQIAGGQHGVITLGQLLEVGVTRPGVTRWVGKGLLHREFRGVYRFGHRAPDARAHYRAAVMACGEGAVLSGLAAAYVFGIVKTKPPAAEVTTTAAREVRGLDTHRVRTLPGRETSVYDRIPITTVPRTLVDIASRLAFDDLAETCHHAGVKFGVKPTAVLRVLERRPKIAGARKLRDIWEGDGITLSKLERLFRKLLRANGLPLPRTNQRIDGWYVDCRWPDRRLTVELDSYTFHHSRHAWERDRRRERTARARGDEYRRYTYGDVTEDPELVLAELRPLLVG
jgi:very-short-patch-repair endonuclease